MTGIELENEAFISEMSGLEEFGAGGGAPMLTAPDCECTARLRDQGI